MNPVREMMNQKKELSKEESCKNNKDKIIKSLNKLIRAELKLAQEATKDLALDLCGYINNAAQLAEVLEYMYDDNFKMARKRAALIDSGWLEFELPEELT